MLAASLYQIAGVYVLPVIKIYCENIIRPIIRKVVRRFVFSAIFFWVIILVLRA